MDLWKVDDVVEWFQSIGHTQYEKSIREHQVGECQTPVHSIVKHQLASSVGYPRLPPLPFAAYRRVMHGQPVAPLVRLYMNACVSARPLVVQVDGLLLLHLMNEDWGHLGITSPLTVRRIDVAMQEYRLRFERKQVRRRAAEGTRSRARSKETTEQICYHGTRRTSLTTAAEKTSSSFCTLLPAFSHPHVSC